VCGPPALMIAAAVVTAAGAAYGGLAANAQGEYGARVAERNAQMANAQAHDAHVRGQLDSARLDREDAQLDAALRRGAMDLYTEDNLAFQRDYLDGRKREMTARIARRTKERL
jgi:hypothetical protein